MVTARDKLGRMTLDAAYAGRCFFVLDGFGEAMVPPADAAAWLKTRGGKGGNSDRMV